MMKKFTFFLILSCLFIFIPTAFSQPVAVEEQEKPDYSVPMFIISIVQLPISIIVTWRISDWYHKKKNEPDQVFQKNRETKLDSLKHRTGQSYSMFKEDFEHILNKNTIVEHDLVAFSSKDYSTLMSNLQHNRKNITDNWNEYVKWVTYDEISKYTNFFTHMLWLLRIFQQEKFSEYDIQEANELCKSIKSISEEFDGISHIIRGISRISSDDSKKLHGITDFKSPITQK